MEGLEKGLLELCLDVQSAVAHELRRDLQAVGVHVAAPILDSGKWRDVFVERARGVTARSGLNSAGWNGQHIFRRSKVPKRHYPALRRFRSASSSI